MRSLKTFSFFFLLLTLAIQAKNSFYKTLQPFLDNYQRPFTILEIQDTQDCFSFAIARDYPQAVCVLFGLNLHNQCQQNQNLHNIILLNKRHNNLTALQQLSECEHIDVTLAPNITKQFGSNWQQALNIVLQMGDYVVIGVPKGKNNIRNNILQLGGTLLEQRPAATNYARKTHTNNKVEVYCIETKKKNLVRKLWFSRPERDKEKFTITSTFAEKKLLKKIAKVGPVTVSDWTPGINLMTFKLCGGVWPEKKIIKIALKDIKDPAHNDWMPHNMILQGNRLALIDYPQKQNPLTQHYFSSTRIQCICALIDKDSPQEIMKFFRCVLLHLKTPT